MRSVNKVILIGNLTRDPELRQTPGGQSIVTFGLATNREWNTKGGEHKESTEFHECAAWGRLAEICQQYLRKSKFIYVEGYLKTRSWDTPEGVKRFKTEIIVQNMIMLEKRPPGEEPNLPVTSGEDLPEDFESDSETSEEPQAENAPADKESADDDLKF